MIIHFLLVLLIAVATVTTYAQKIVPVPSRKFDGGEELLGAWLSEEEFMLSMSIGDSGKIDKMQTGEIETNTTGEVLKQTGPPSTCTATDISRCDELIKCMDIITGAPLDLCGVDKDEVCTALLYFYGDEGVTSICNAASLFITEPCGCGGENSTDVYSETILLAAPTCQARSPVTYPDESGDGTGYDNFVASIAGPFLTAGKRARANPDSVGAYLASGLSIGKIAGGASEICNEEIAKIFTLGACTVAKTAIKTTQAALEIVQIQIEYHNRAIDMAEIKATFGNTNLILDQTCNMIAQTQSLEDQTKDLENAMNTQFDEVDGKLDQANGKLDQANAKLDQANTKLDQANEKLDQANAKLDQANAKLDKLLCPFGPGGATFTALRQGCDAIDQDCNGVVDECSEDKVPPSLTLRTPIPDKSFKSTDEARQFLQENVIISDDCAAEFQTFFTLLSEENCCNCEFQVATADARCVNENTPGSAANRKFIVKVDSAAPVINCGFFVQQDLFHVSGGFDPCGDLPVPFPGANDPLHIDKSSVGQGLFGVGLWYQIEDECDKGILPVTVHVLSNELTIERNAWIVERNDLPNVVHRANVYLSPTGCRDDLSSSNICEIEETEDDSVTTRFYDIVISATDDAGNTGTKICSVIVVPDDHYSVDSIGKSGKSSRVGHNPDDLREEYKLSTKRHVISKLSLEWDPNLDTTLAIPPLPERDINSKSGKSSKSFLCEGKGSKSQGNSAEIDSLTPLSMFFGSVDLSEEEGSKEIRDTNTNLAPLSSPNLDMMSKVSKNALSEEKGSRDTTLAPLSSPNLNMMSKVSKSAGF